MLAGEFVPVIYEPANMKVIINISKGFFFFPKKKRTNKSIKNPSDVKKKKNQITAYKQVGT